MKKFIYYLVFLSLVACKKTEQQTPLPVISCDKPTKDPNIARQLIVGTWVWTYSKFYIWGGGGYETTTPKSENITRKMVFDSKGNLSIFENGQLKVETKYQFEKLSAISYYPADSTRYIISWKNGKYPTVYRICSDSLYLPYQSFTYDHLSDEVWEKN